MMVTALKDSSVVRLYVGAAVYEGVAVQYFFRRMKPAITDEVYGKEYEYDFSDGEESVTTLNCSDDDDGQSDDSAALNEENLEHSEEKKGDEQSEADDAKEDSSNTNKESDSSYGENDSADGDTGEGEDASMKNDTAVECVWEKITNERKRAFAEVEE